MKIKSIYFVFLFMLLGCSVSKTQHAPEKVFRLKYACYTQGLKDRLPNCPDTELKLIFNIIPGEIIGQWRKPIIDSVVPGQPDFFSLSLPSNPDLLAARINDKKLEVTPRNTRILRVGTFNKLPQYKRGQMGAVALEI